MSDRTYAARVKIRSRALAALATATLVLGLASPAHAASTVRDDARNDVVRGHADSDSVTPAPRANQGDVRRFVVAHRSSDVVVTARFNDLVRGRQFQVSFLELVTPTLGRNLEISVEPGGPAQGTVEFTNRASRTVRCDGLTTRIDWSTNVIRATVPRSCLGNPRWVRAGYGFLRVNYNLDIWMDDAHRNGRVADRLALGPRTYRG